MLLKLSILFGALVPVIAFASQPFENSAILRHVVLGGPVVEVSTTYTVKAIQAEAQVYKIALGAEERHQTSWFEVHLRGNAEKLPMEDLGIDSNGVYLIAATLPTPLKLGETVQIIVDTVRTRVTWPWPRRAAQEEEQSLKFKTDLFIPSPYTTATQRIKIRCPSPRIISFTEPKEVEQYLSGDAPVGRSGTTITYGPFINVGRVNANFLHETQQQIYLHYGYEFPVLEITKLNRAAEISHWGANLNIQDDVSLYNAGPELDGHFSRLTHQLKHMQPSSPQSTQSVLTSLTLQLPAGIRDVYYYDLNGNVSTSHLITAASPSRSEQSRKKKHSTLTLKPRYPLLGGWKYSFTLGWDAPLQDSARWDTKKGKYIVSVPILTALPGAVVNEAELKVILPEGATDIEYYLPFPALSMSRGSHTTYLDTMGRPSLTFRFEQLTHQHAQPIYVLYKVPLASQLRKPFAVACALLGLYMIAFVGRRVDPRIDKA